MKMCPNYDPSDSLKKRDKNPPMATHFSATSASAGDSSSSLLSAPLHPTPTLLFIVIPFLQFLHNGLIPHLW